MLRSFTSAYGKLVRLEPLSAQDITEEYVSWLNDPRAVRFSNQRFFSHTIASCNQYLASFIDAPHLLLKIVINSTGQMVGTMTAYASVHHGTVDIGILIGPAAWGKGIGQDAWNALIGWLSRNPSVRKITAGTMRPNVSMVRIMERAGMTLEAIRPKQELLDGQPVDLLYYGKFSD